MSLASAILAISFSAVLLSLGVVSLLTPRRVAAWTRKFHPWGDSRFVGSRAHMLLVRATGLFAAIVGLVVFWHAVTEWQRR